MFNFQNVCFSDSWYDYHTNWIYNTDAFSTEFSSRGKFIKCMIDYVNICLIIYVSAEN